MQKIVISFLILLVSSAVFSQEDTTTIKNVQKDTVNLDDMRPKDVLQLGHNHFRVGNYEEAEFMYTYLYQKGYFLLDFYNAYTEVSLRNIYWRLVELKISKHDYKKAQHFLSLALEEPQFQHFCGNAIMANIQYERANILECELGLAEGEKRKELLSEMISKAFSNKLYESNNAYIHGLINYLSSMYSVNEIVYYFRMSRETLTAKRDKRGYRAPIECKLRVFGIETNFSFYTAEYEGTDSQILQKYACAYLVDRIKSYSGFE